MVNESVVDWRGGVPFSMEGGVVTHLMNILYYYRPIFIGVIHENSAVYDAMRFAANKTRVFSDVSVVFKPINTTEKANLFNQGKIFVCVIIQ